MGVMLVNVSARTKPMPTLLGVAAYREGGLPVDKGWAYTER